MAIKAGQRVAIYALCCPLTGEVRYVGKTCGSLERRLRGHISEATRYPHLHKSRWIRSLGSGARPEIRLLELVTDENWQERERYWIRQFQNLTNSADGGAGCPPIPKTADHVAKVHAALLGRPGRACPLEQRVKISAALKGKRKSDEHAAQVRLARCGKGSALTAEQVLNIRRRRDEPQMVLAVEFGVSQPTISDIQRRKRWAHLPEEV